MSEKRCYYEVLCLPQSCTHDEIRSAYKRLALQRHPDKLIQSGTAPEDATASFQELRRAYEVLSDPKERSFYDSHRSQILFASSSTSTSSSSATSSSSFDVTLTDHLYSYFSASCYTDYSDGRKGFYRVYGDLFNRIFRNEVTFCGKMGLGLGLVKEAPRFGDLGSADEEVMAFYGYWLGFTTVLDFGWLNKWDVMGGVSRRERRLMEEENSKVRKKAKRDFNDTVRGLAEFVKKRDKRMIEMGVRKEKEREKKREEEARKKKEREQEKAERARAFVVPEWARVDEELIGDDDDEEEEEDEEKEELYCTVCKKKFKSDKQWKNHEQSKKHKEKVAELRRVFEKEDHEFEGVEVSDVDEEDIEVNEEDNDGFMSAEEDVDDLGEKFKPRVGVMDENDTFEDGSNDEYVQDELNEKFEECVVLEEGKDNDAVSSGGEDGVDNAKEPNGVEKPVLGSDKDASILEAMMSGRRHGKHVSFKDPIVEQDGGKSEDEMETMEYNNKKGKKKSRRAKKDKGKGFDGSNDPGENSNAPGGSNVVSDGDDDGEAHNARGRTKAGKKGADRKSKRDAESKPKNSGKGRKQKDKDAEPMCETCGMEFDSRNRLYKHLSDTGHASLKSR